MTAKAWRETLTAGKPDPPVLVAPAGGWPDDLEASVSDEEGYPVVTPGVARRVEIPPDFAGRLTVRLMEETEYDIVIGGGPVHLRLLIEVDNPTISLSFRTQATPQLTGARFGRHVSPIYTNGDHGLGLIEFSKPFTTSSDMVFSRRRAVLRPGDALVSQPVWLWLHGISLYVAAPPIVTPTAGPGVTVTGGPARNLCNDDGGVVLAPGNISVEGAAEVQPVAEVRARGGAPGVYSSVDCHIDKLIVHTGGHVAILPDQTVRSAALHRASRLSLAEYCAVDLLEAAVADLDMTVPEDTISRVTVEPRGSDRVTAVRQLVGPLRVEFAPTQRGANAKHDQPGALWIHERADTCTFVTEPRWFRSDKPPTVRWTSGATGSGLRFDTTVDEDHDPPREAFVAMHLDERSAVYDASGTVAIRAAARATIDGSVHGLLLRKIVDPDQPAPRKSVDSISSESGSTEGPAQPEIPPGDSSPLAVIHHSVFAGAHVSRVQVDLTSHHGHRILEELREAELAELHHKTWSPSNSPLGCRSPTAKLSGGKRVWHTLAGWPPPTHSERQHELGLEVLSDISRSKARSGTVRSGVAHAVLTTRSGRSAFIPERILLLTGRSLGFGHRIGRPLVVWAGLAVAIAAVVMADGGFDPSLAGLGRLLSGSANALAEPAGVVRGVRPETWLDTEIERPWVVTGARTLLALPLAAAVLAIARRSRTR